MHVFSPHAPCAHTPNVGTELQQAAWFLAANSMPVISNHYLYTLINDGRSLPWPYKTQLS